MASDGNGSGVVTVYGNNGAALLEPSKQSKSATFSVKVGLAQMLRGGVIAEAGAETGGRGRGLAPMFPNLY